jgi:hypothetical protein
MGERGLLQLDNSFRMAHQFGTLTVGSYRFLLPGTGNKAEERARVRAGVKLFLDGFRSVATSPPLLAKTTKVESKGASK